MPNTSSAVRGGSRPGAGRPKGESTTTVRIPTVLLPLVSLLCSVHRGDLSGAVASYDLLSCSPLRSSRRHWSWTTQLDVTRQLHYGAIEFGISDDASTLGYRVCLQLDAPLDAAQVGGM